MAYIETPQNVPTDTSAPPEQSADSSFLSKLKQYGGDLKAVRDAAARSIPFSNQIKAGIGSLDGLNPNNPADPKWRNESIGQRYDQQLAQVKNDEAQEITQHPVTTIAGDVLGTVPQVLVGEGAVAPLLEKAGAALSATKVGEAADKIPLLKQALSHLAKPVTNLAENIPGVAVNAVQGAGSGNNPIEGGAEGAIAGAQDSPLENAYTHLGTTGAAIADAVIPPSMMTLLSAGFAGLAAAQLDVGNNGNPVNDDTSAHETQNQAAQNPVDYAEQGDDDVHLPNVQTDAQGRKIFIAPDGTHIPLNF